MNKKKKSQGFIGIIVVVIIAIIILSYLGFDLKKIFTSDMMQNNFSYVWGIIKNIWANYLSVPFTFVWNEILKPLLGLAWKAFVYGLDAIKNGNAANPL